MTTRAPAIDLTRSRDLGDILGGAFSLYWRHFALFAGVTYAVLVPFTALVYLLKDHVPGTLVLLSAWLAAVPLITAGHVHGLVTLEANRDSSARDALRAAARRLPAVAAAAVLVWISTLLGCLLLIIPGIYVATRLYVSIQAVVAESLGPVNGIRRSEELVDGHGWRVFGTAILIAVVATVLAVAAVVPFSIITTAADSDALSLVGGVVANGVWVSFSALAGTLLYFDLKARHGGALEPSLQYPEFPPRDWDAPERPY